ncbi:MAG: Gfo/Idh/MocA family oxidoreductase [Armatimonadetes bacterium]|nr:Gfo/Idh/MocA family oxidoreductase [Armatimonadota bacterium]MDE2206394.1 Gfo/Idh/MocA family oxidoreductase [Armatimonadota bacterium]
MPEKPRFNVTRRALLSSATASLVAAGLPQWFAAEAAAETLETRSARKRKLDQNSQIQAGVIGPGGSGGGFAQGLNDARNLNGHDGAKIIAVCDVDDTHRDEAAAAFGPGTQKFHDFRDLLARPEIDAVVIGTPDHWHVLAAIAALRAGKHVYCEKPLTLFIEQGIKLVQVAKESGKRFQVGSQQRSDARFRLACELVRNGRIGRISQAVAHLPTGPTGGPFAVQPVRTGLDWNFWLGPTPATDYVPERCFGNFRWWLEYSGGMLTDWGAHHNDICQWGLGTEHTGPVKVQAFGKGPIIGEECYSTFPEFDVTSTFADGRTILSTNKGDNGVTFNGENGQWIFVSRSDIKASDPTLLTEPLQSDAIRLYKSDDHMGNFLDCIRDGKETICPAEIGHRSVSICHLCNISLRLDGRILNWDPDKQQMVGDKEAQAMTSRPMRHPWTL